MFAPDVLERVQERQRAIVSLLRAIGNHNLADRDILEIGCGTGANLLEFLALGADPGRLVGNDLLADRLNGARRVLPGSVQLIEGNASSLNIADCSFDIVYQSTVFSSIQDSALQTSLAISMWRWVKPGGGVLWYDFVYNNPSNQDVSGVPLRRVRVLFPEGKMTVRRITLAPPIARWVTAFHPWLYPVFNAIPFLRTHILCWIQKQ